MSIALPFLWVLLSPGELPSAVLALVMKTSSPESADAPTTIARTVTRWFL
ncbi:MAG: hypothetical protein ABJX94_10780 [Flavobacteriaceae bacterium]